MPLLPLLLLSLASILPGAPSTSPLLERCEEPRYRSDREVVYEARPFTVDGEALAIEAPVGGSIAVRAWDGDTVEVVACVKAVAATEAEGRRLIDAVRIETAQGIRTEGPAALGRPGSDEGTVTVSFEVRVPRQTDLDIRAQNGAVSVVGVSGRVYVETVEGAVELDDLAGDVRVRTVDGSVTARLGGEGWTGEGLDVIAARSGDMTLAFPALYSAELAVATRAGRVALDGVDVQNPRVRPLGAGEAGRSISGTMGDGGAAIRLTTGTGDIALRQR